MKSRIYSLRKEASEPHIGIFWLYRGQVLVFSQPASSIPLIGGFKDAPFEHPQSWPQVVKMFPELADKEYSDIPRGRVTFSMNGKFIINLGPKEASNPILVARIIHYFSLPRDRTIAVADVHYGTFEDADTEPS